MKQKLLEKYSPFFKPVIFAMFLIVGFFGFGKLPEALAGECKFQIVFDAKPNPARFNQPVELKGSINFTGSVFNPPGSAGEGYCNHSGNPVKNIYIRFREGGSASYFSVGNFLSFGQSPYITLTVPTYINQPLSFSKVFTPSEVGYKAGDTLRITAEAYSAPVFTSSDRVVNSGIVQLSFIEGVYSSFGCIGDDNKYWCSPTNNPTCSDVPKRGQCADSKNCMELKDSQLCGQTATPGTQPGMQPGTVQPGAQIGTVQPGAQIVTPSGIDCGTLDPKSADYDKYCIHNPLPESELTKMLIRIMKGFLGIIAVWAVAFIVIGGFRMVMAQGNEEAYIAAKKTITWAILGMVIALLSFSIVAMVQNVLGV